MDFKEKVSELLGEEQSEKVEAINKIIPEFFIPKSKYNELSGKYKTLETEKAELESEIENNKNSQLTDKERLDKAIEKHQNAEKDFAKKSNKLEAEKIFINAKLTNDDYKDFIDDIVTDNYDNTIRLANAFVKTISNKVEMANTSTKEDLLKQTPRPSTGTGDELKITKEDFNKMNVYEKTKLYSENKSLYQELSKGE